MTKRLAMYRHKFSKHLAKLTCIGGTDPQSPHHADLNACLERLKENEVLQKKLDHCIKLEKEYEKREAEMAEQAAAQKLAEAQELQQKEEELATQEAILKECCVSAAELVRGKMAEFDPSSPEYAKGQSILKIWKGWPQMLRKAILARQRNRQD